MRILNFMSVFVLCVFTALGLLAALYGDPINAGGVPGFYWVVFLIAFGISPYFLLLGIIDVVLAFSMLRSLRRTGIQPNWLILIVYMSTFIATVAFLIYTFVFAGVFFGDGSTAG